MARAFGVIAGAIGARHRVILSRMASEQPVIRPEDMWVLRHQVLQNLYGLKFAALRRVLDALEAAHPTNPTTK